MADPRLPEALKRAAEFADAYDKAGTSLGWIRARQAVLGWAAAIQALMDDGHGTPNWHHDGCTGCTSTAKFITAMLGGDDA